MIKRQLTLSLDSPTNKKNGQIFFTKPPMFRRNTEKDFKPSSYQRKKSNAFSSDIEKENQQEENFLTSFGDRNILNKNDDSESSVVLSPMAISRCICILIQKLMISSQQIECKIPIDPLTSVFPSVSHPDQFTPETYAVFSRSYVSQKPREKFTINEVSLNSPQQSETAAAAAAAEPSKTSPVNPSLSQAQQFPSSSSIASKGEFSSDAGASPATTTSGIRFFSRSGRGNNNSASSLSKSPSRIKDLLFPSKSSSHTVKVPFFVLFHDVVSSVGGITPCTNTILFNHMS